MCGSFSGVSREQEQVWAAMDFVADQYQLGTPWHQVRRALVQGSEAGRFPDPAVISEDDFAAIVGPYVGPGSTYILSDDDLLDDLAVGMGLSDEDIAKMLS